MGKLSREVQVWMQWVWVDISVSLGGNLGPVEARGIKKWLALNIWSYN